MAFYPKTYRNYRSEAKEYLSSIELKKYIGPVFVLFEFVFNMASRGKKTPIPVGDVDNLMKSILDVMQDVCVIDDDRNVIGVIALKRYGLVKDEPAHTKVTVVPYVCDWSA